MYVAQNLRILARHRYIAPTGSINPLAPIQSLLTNQPIQSYGSRPETLNSACVWPTAMTGAPERGCCRFCGTTLGQTVIDLGMSPLCESFLTSDQLNGMERFYPLHVWVCDRCFLVQLEEYVSGTEIFSDYAYFSSFSDSWLDHSRRYVEQMIDQLALTARSEVVEIASNDGYLLQFFVQRGIPALGVEPAANVAKAA